MHPFLTALGSNPALINAVRAGARELRPGFEKALSSRPWQTGGKGGRATAVIVLGTLAAGVAAGWLTAPRSGALLRARLKDGLKSWRFWAARPSYDQTTDFGGGAEPAAGTAATSPVEAHVEVTAPD